MQQTRLRRRLSFALAMVLTATEGSLRAHHSLSSAYDNTRRVTIEAVLREFHFVNPHPYAIVDVMRGGAATPFRIEFDNRVELVEIGMAADTFKAGDHLTVVGAPARQAVNGIYVRELDRASDGLHYEQLNATPRLRRGTTR